MERQCILCEIGIDFLNIICISEGKVSFLSCYSLLGTNFCHVIYCKMLINQFLCQSDIK